MDAVNVAALVLALVLPAPDRATDRCAATVAAVELIVDDVGLASADSARVRQVLGDTVVVHLTSGVPSRSMLDTIETRIASLTGRPGRKSLIVLSAGIVVKASPAPGVMRLPDGALRARLRQIARAANEAGVVLSFVNVPRADPWVLVRHDLLDSPYDRAAEGPGYLAAETGGVFAKNPGDLALVTARLLADGRSPYILGSAMPPAAEPVARPCQPGAPVAPARR